jgi:hypothetical protein
VKVLGKDFKEWHETAWPEDYIWADGCVLNDGRDLYDQVTGIVVLRDDEMFMLPDWMIEPESVFHPKDRAERALSVRKLFKSWLKERSTVRIMIEVPKDQEAVTRDWLKSGLVFHKGKVL